MHENAGRGVTVCDGCGREPLAEKYIELDGRILCYRGVDDLPRGM